VQQVTYNIDGFALSFADQIQDLGVHHDCRLKYDKHTCLVVHNIQTCCLDFKMQRDLKTCFLYLRQTIVTICMLDLVTKIQIPDP